MATEQDSSSITFVVSYYPITYENYFGGFYKIVPKISYLGGEKLCVSIRGKMGQFIFFKIYLFLKFS